MVYSIDSVVYEILFSLILCTLFYHDLQVVYQCFENLSLPVLVYLDVAETFDAEGIRNGGAVQIALVTIELFQLAGHVL
jgi:hypothetical protein